MCAALASDKSRAACIPRKEDAMTNDITPVYRVVVVLYEGSNLQAALDAYNEHKIYAASSTPKQRVDLLRNANTIASSDARTDDNAIRRMIGERHARP